MPLPPDMSGHKDWFDPPSNGLSENKGRVVIIDDVVGGPTNGCTIDPLVEKSKGRPEARHPLAVPSTECPEKERVICPGRYNALQ